MFWSRFCFLIKGDIIAFLKQGGITPDSSELLTIVVKTSITVSMCLNKKSVGIGSSWQDLGGDDKISDFRIQLA